MHVRRGFPRGGKPAGPWVRSVSLTCGKPRGRQDGGVKRKFTDIMCWRWCGREESPQAFGSAGGYPLTCHQATGMMGAWTRPRLLHERYKRIHMYGSISTGKLPSHQRDPVEGIASRSPLLRGHVKVGELRTQRPGANRRLKCQHGHHKGMI